MGIISKNNYIVKHFFKAFFIATLLTAIVGIVNGIFDSIIVSHLVSSDAMSVVSLSVPPSIFAMCIITLIHSGASYLATLALGKNDIEELSFFFSLDILFTTITGGFFCLFVLSFVPEISSYITTEPRLIGMMNQFISMDNITVALRCISLVFKTYICILGHPRKVSYSVITETITNLILDLLLCGPLNLGCFGATLATAIAIVVSTVQLIPCFKRCDVSFTHTNNITFIHFTKSLKASTPTILGCILAPVSMYISNLFIQKSLGADGIYVFAILLQIISFCNIITTCCSKTLRNLGGILWGEEDYCSFRALFHLIFKISVTASVIIFTVIFIFPEKIFTIYGASETLSNAQAVNVREAVVAILPQALVILLGVLYYIQGYHKLCVIINTVATVGSATLIVGICQYCPDYFWSIYPFGYWLILVVMLAISSFYRKNRPELEKFTLIPIFSEKPSMSCSIKYSKDSVNEALNKLYSFIDIIETDNAMMVKIALEELLFTILEHNPNTGNNVFFDVRVVDNDNHLDISVKDSGIPYNSIVHYNENEIMSLDQTDFRLGVVGRVCKSISYEYLNGVNCTFLKFDIIRNSSI